MEYIRHQHLCLLSKNPKVALVEGFEFVNLGYNMIKDLRTTIDWKNKLIRFEKSSAGETIENDSLEENLGETNTFTGWYGGKVRKVLVANDEMYLQRGGAAKLKLVPINGDLYKTTHNVPIMNELPNVRFERDKEDQVIGLTFIYKDGREDFVKKYL